MASCLQPSRVEALLVGALDETERENIHRHIDRCGPCRTMLAGAARNKAAQAYGRSTHAAISAPALRSVQPGDILDGRFVVQHRIGEGGAGVVWQGEHRVTQELVALKILRSGEGNTSRRFLREARVTAALRHPNLVPILDAFVDPESSHGVLVMERLQGASLAERLHEAGGSLPAADVLVIGTGIAAGLGAAHGLGVVHRDLKPANVFVRRNPSRARPAHIEEADIVVLDFGIAKLTAEAGAAANTGALTRSGTLLGTPHYMAPEQVRAGATVDASADVWALGVVLYECTSGVRPVEGVTALEVSRALLRLQVEPLARRCPDVPPGLAALVQCMLDPEVARRPTMTEVESELRRETALVGHERLW